MRALLAMVVAVSVFALVPPAAQANNDNYACSLVPPLAVVKKEFGLPHAVKEKDTAGGTDNANGAFSSTCVVFAWRTKPKPGIRPFGKTPKFRVRKGFAKLAVSTTIQDDEEAGENWNPADLRLNNLEVHDLIIEEWKGREVFFPLFGQTEAHGVEWGVLADNAGAFWGREEDGFLNLEVASHGGPAGQHLVQLGQLIVPKFAP
jgi:hypothetical protein